MRPRFADYARNRQAEVHQLRRGEALRRSRGSRQIN